VPVNKTGYLTNVIGTHTVNAIDRYAASGSNFFLSVHFNAPHWPWEGPDDKAESKRIAQSGFAPGTNDLSKLGLRHRDGGSRSIYEAMVKAMDDEVGRIVDTLKRHGLYENTIIIFTSDNGGERFSNTWPFSGQKTELLEGGIRIPTIISWPLALPRGVVHEQVNIHFDWLPTLLAAARTRPDPNYPSDGINLLPILQGKAPIQERRLYWRYKANHQRALRDGDYKYLQIAGNSYLFNVAADPLERANLKHREADKFDKLAALWKQWNAGMLPEMDETFTEGVLAVEQADHIGAQSTLTIADPGD
jgi:arylsulfatase A-like enzyme